MSFIQIESKAQGEIYIGVLIAIGIFLILSQAVSFLSGTAYELIGFNRARTNAQLIANERIELIRNLAFDDVGTSGGIPSGPLLQNESITQNGLTYSVQTSVIYVDDEFDGVSPDDLTPNDYKRARVEVEFSNLGRASSSVVMVTDVAPKGIEQTTGGGTLSILVFDSNGVPVPQATVTISASTTPPVNLTLTTNNNGRIVLPGAPACSTCYSISTTKSGYSTDRTYSTSEVDNPAKSPVSVITGQLTETSFAIDKVSTLNISSVDTRLNGFAAIPGQSFSIHGGKIIGTTSLDLPIYKYNQVVTTNGSGTVQLQNLEWDVYTITEATASSKMIATSNPLLPISINPDQNYNISISLTDDISPSLMTWFVDGGENLVASVSGRITKQTFEASSSSGLSTDPDFGQIYWGGLEAGQYTIEATVSGYLPYNSTITVSGNTIEKIILSQ